MIGAKAGPVAIELDVPTVAGETKPRGCPWQNDISYTTVGNATCVYDIFKRGMTINAAGPCHGYRSIDPATNEAGDFAWVTYAETDKNVLALGAYMRAKLRLDKGDFVGVYGKNSVSWATVQLAVSAQGMTIVPLYDTLGSDSVEYIINHADIKALCVSVENVGKVMRLVDTGKLQTVKNIIVFGSADVESEDAVNHELVKNGRAVSIGAAIKEGMSMKGDASNKGGLDDMAIMMYTSGTTGDPKGVKHLNRALVGSTAAAHAYFAHYGVPFTNTDALLSYLPLAHIFEQHTEADIYAAGGRIGYFQGDIMKLLEDLQALKPTMFVGVPRVYMRFQQKIEEATEATTGLKKMLFDVAYNSGLKAEQTLTNRNFLLDHLVMNKIRNQIMPNVRLMITGSAPLSSKTNDYLKVCLNSPLVQGYGLTESTGGFLCSPPSNSVSGNCGGPLPGCFVKLRDVAEMNYLSTDKPYPRGEVMLKGDLVTVGYYQNEEETAKTLTSDGWFSTGDIGQFLEGGSLQIIDRKKNMFKLSQGEYVSPEVLENEYVKCKLVGQIWVYGSSFESYLVAVVVPDPTMASKWAHAKGKETKDLGAITRMAGFEEEVLKQLAAAKVENNFKGFEGIKKVHFENQVNEVGQGFTMENNLLTPTFKFKRPQLYATYKGALEGMYCG